MIVGFYGVMGSGKSISATALALDYLNKGYMIYSNYAIFKRDSDELIDEWRDIPLEQLRVGDWTPNDKSILLIDELDRLMDARRSMSKGNISIDRLLRHARKLKTHLVYTTHFRNLIDVRLENLITGGWGIEIDCKFYWLCGRCNNLNLRVDFCEECNASKDGYLQDAFVKWDIIDYRKEVPQRGSKMLEVSDYFGRYDTDELIGGFG